MVTIFSLLFRAEFSKWVYEGSTEWKFERKRIYEKIVIVTFKFAHLYCGYKKRYTVNLIESKYLLNTSLISFGFGTTQNFREK